MSVSFQERVSTEMTLPWSSISSFIVVVKDETLFSPPTANKFCPTEAKAQPLKSSERSTAHLSSLTL